MKPKSKLQVVTALLLLLLLVSSIGGARHEHYSAASSSDGGIHSFFSDLIRDAEICLDNFVDESPYADIHASRLESRIKLAVEESRFYAVKGFESNVSRVVQPFSTLSGGAKQLTRYQLVFLSNYELLKNESDYPAYVEARTAIVNMRAGADTIKSSLERTELIVLWNESSTLNFNVSDLSEKLNKAYALINHYERLLEQYELKAPAFEDDILVVALSNEQPHLYEEITIHVYAKNITRISLFIDNETHSLKNLTAELQKKHRFDRHGEHLIYAEGRTVDGKNITSNIVKVKVSKIPTFILLSSQYSALLNDRVKITGLILDYYEKPLHAVNVTVEAGGEETSAISDSRGLFAFYGTRSSEGCLNVSAFYPGSEIYNSSSANISILFSRFSLAILIESGNMDVNVNETVNLSGSVSGINYSYNIPLTIVANDLSLQTIRAVKDFGFALSFSRPGTYEVYASFPGDSMFTPAKSNVVTITVREKPFFQEGSIIKEILYVLYNEKEVEEIIIKYREFNILFICFLLLISAIYACTFKKVISALKGIRSTKGGGHRSRFHLFLYKTIAPLLVLFMNFYTLILKRNNHNSKEEEAEPGNESASAEKQAVTNEEVVKMEARKLKKLEAFELDLGEAYRLLFDATITQYDLRKSLTPREVLEAIKKGNETFTDAFIDVTAIHERAFYGGMGPVDGEEERYFKAIADILRRFKE